VESQHFWVTVAIMSIRDFVTMVRRFRLRFSVGMGRPIPGHARAVEGGEGSATVEWSFTRSAENGMSNLQ
jgi:hypothetical protein